MSQKKHNRILKMCQSMNDDCVTKSCDHETHSHMTLAFIGENGNNKNLKYSTGNGKPICFAP